MDRGLTSDEQGVASRLSPDASVRSGGDPAIVPFADSLEHLLAELERVDLMVRSRVAELRRVQSQDEHFRGLYISEDEVDALLERPIGLPQWLAGSAADGAAFEEPRLLELREHVARRCMASEAAGIELRLPRLTRLFGLDAFDVDALLVCLAVEIDLRYERLYAYLQDDVTKKRPGVALVIALLSGDGPARFTARRRFAASAPLMQYRLVHRFEEPSMPHSPWLAHFLKVDDRLVRFLLGGAADDVDDDDLDDELRGIARLVVPKGGFDALLIDAAQRLAWRAALPAQSTPAATAGETASTKAATTTVNGNDSAVVLIDGPAGSGRTTLPMALCHERGLSLLVVDVVAASMADDTVRDGDASARRWMRLVQAAEREALLHGAAVLWRGVESVTDETQRRGLAALWRAIDAGRAPCFVVDTALAREPTGFARRGTVTMRVPLATASQRVRYWELALAGRPLAADVDLPALASRFKLSFGRIDEAVTTALAGAAAPMQGTPVVTQRDLQDACRLHSNQRLSSLARKTASHHQWSDIVLPDDRIAQLREICNQVKYRERVYGEWGFGAKLALGKGLAVLFAGPSGTGKTMSAGIIASELGLDLYKIDLSTVVSKYIGETEKNLSRIFDEAETSNAILFFDEADALFGKRSEVRDSHDRYANIEVGYLLQRMEEYEGIAILATNLRKNMDDAFVRRLHFTVEFPLPDAADRHRIWRAIWPADMPRDDTLDLKRLADQYEMTGGNIRNVALAAAFLAADDAQPVVRLEHLAKAVQREYQKTGRLMGDYGDSGAPRVRARR